MFCQGHNAQGALGNNSTGNTSTPTQIYMGGALAGKTIKSMSAGYGSACAIASDNFVYCWGDGYQGSLGNGLSTTATGSSIQPIKVNGVIQNIQMKQIARNGYMACALSLDDRLFCWGGYTSVPTEVVLPNSEKTKFISLGSALSSQYSCMITQSNKVYCVSIFSLSPVLINTTSGDAMGKTFTKITSGSGIACLISDDNFGYCFSPGAPSTPPSLIALSQTPYNKSIKSIGLGQVHTCASTTDNEVYCWGQNSFGQLGDGTLNASGSPVLVNFN